MRSFKSFKDKFDEHGGRREQERLEKGFDVLLSGANQERIKNQQRRREILRAASVKLKNDTRPHLFTDLKCHENIEAYSTLEKVQLPQEEIRQWLKNSSPLQDKPLSIPPGNCRQSLFMSCKQTVNIHTKSSRWFREGPRGRKNWKKVPDIKIKASDGTKVNVPNPVTMDEDVVVAPEMTIAAVSPAFTDHSDYTVSSASVDGKAPESNPDMQIESFSGILGQWDMVENASCITSVSPLCNKESKITVTGPAVNLQSIVHVPCSWERTASRQEDRSPSSSEHSEAFCWPSRNGVHDNSREEFDIVYDVFYQDEAFEPYEAFMVTEDFQNGVQEESKENVDLPDDTLSRSATPPLERVESPQFSSRVNLKTLPSMSTSNEEFLSFSRRDLSVLRQSLRELQVGMFQENYTGLHGATSEEIQEDVIPARGLIEEEEEELVPKSVTARSSVCQEMLTQQERKVRPLSAARVVRPLSSNIVLGRQTQPDDFKERCPQLIAVAELPRAELIGAQARTNEIVETIFQREKRMHPDSAEIDYSFHRADMGSCGSSLTSSYATPRTGISVDDQEGSVCKRKTQSRPEPQEPSEVTILELLSAKVQLLDVFQQKYLLRVLDKLERAKMSGSLNLPSMFASLERPWMGLPLISAEVEEAPMTHLIVLRILSTWGDNKCVGLVEVELFDVEGTKLELPASSLSLQGCPPDTSPCETICRLLNGIVNTTREKNMWLCPLPAAGDSPLEIHIQAPALDVVPGHLKVWNYNRSVGDTTKGVREMQVYVDGELIWQGMVAKGCGNRVFDYSSKIPLLDDTPLSATTSTTHVQSNSGVQENHFIPNDPDVESKLPEQIVSVPDGVFISVGTSFTVSPVEGSSSPSSCCTLTSTSSTLEERSLLIVASELSGQDVRSLPLPEVLDSLRVDGADESNGVDRVISLPVLENARTNLSERVGEGGVTQNSTDTMPIWLEGE